MAQSLLHPAARPRSDPRDLRVADSSWDFRGEDTKYATHGIFRYPAMMVAPVVRRLIDTYGPKEAGGRLLDPFCGSGSALVEGMLHGMASFGVDLNPFATQLAKVKTTPLDPTELRRCHARVAAQFDEAPPGEPNVDLPTLKFWFSPKAIRDLGRLRSVIGRIRQADVREFFDMCLAETARYVSWTRRDEYKVFRIPEDKRKLWHPDVLSSFSIIVLRNVARMDDFVSRLPEDATNATVVAGDVRLPGTIPPGHTT